MLGIIRNVQKMKTKAEYHYIIQGFDLEYYDGIEIDTIRKSMTEKQMIKYAKGDLKYKHKSGKEKETKTTDLSQPINAWIYLLDNGFGIETNRKVW